MTGEESADGPDDPGGSLPDHGDGVDPVTLEVVRNACASICGEMNATLIRTAYSPNIKERKDCSCALFDAEGRMVAQAENMPVHLGAMPFSVAAALERFSPDELEPGDAVLLNDPYDGGAHLPDLTLVTPVFDERGGEPELVAFAANRAHHADVGGARAGSVAADSTEIYQEGLRIPPVKLYERGEESAAVFDIVLRNVRTPDERRGDLRAQEAANETGSERFRELVADRGRTAVREALAAVQDYSERRMRAELDAVPDGTYRFEDVLDDDGRGNEDLPVVATVTVDGGTVTVDFSGTADQTAGPVNAVRAVTVSATYYAVRAVTDPSIPPNEGCYRPITVETPAGSLVDPDPPAAVVGGNLETSQRVTDVVLGAFAEAVPDRAAAAGQGTMNNVTFGGVDPRDGSPYAFYETQGGGFGGRDGLDGLDGVHVHMSNTLNTPAEVLETAYPLRVRRYALRPDSGGAGAFRGGLGLRRDVEARGPATFSLLADRHRSAPYGLRGGEPGARGAAFLRRAGAGDGPDPDDGTTDHAEPDDTTGNGDDGTGQAGTWLPPKCTRELAAGDVVSLRTPGGGGYGDPADRDPGAVARDLRLGKLTPAAARERYGYDPDPGPDTDADADAAPRGLDGEPTGDAGSGDRD